MTPSALYRRLLTAAFRRPRSTNCRKPARSKPLGQFLTLEDRAVPAAVATAYVADANDYVITDDADTSGDLSDGDIVSLDTDGLFGVVTGLEVGVDAFTQIQPAVDNLLADGVVHVFRGNFDSGVVVNVEGADIVGWDVLGTSPVVDASADTYAFQVAANNVFISGFHLQDDGDAVGVQILEGFDGATVQFNVIDGFATGIATQDGGGGAKTGSNNNFLFVNTITNADVGIDIYNGTNSNVNSNTVTDSTTANVRLTGETLTFVGFNTLAGSPVGIDVTDSQSATVYGNAVTGTGIGISLDGGTDNEVSGNNTVTDSTTANVRVTGETSAVVVYNTLTGSPVGIDVIDSQFTGIGGNTVTGAGVGISLDGGSDNGVNANTVTDSTTANVRLTGETYDFVESNAITGGAVGISLDGGANNLVHYNTVGKATMANVTLAGETGDSVAGNTVTGGAVGISLDGGTGNGVGNNTIDGATTANVILTGETYDFVYSNAITGGAVGIALDSGAYNTVFYNTIGKATTANITLTAETNDSLDSNVITGGAVGIALGSGASNTVVYNTVGKATTANVVITDETNVFVNNNVITGSAVGVDLNGSLPGARLAFNTLTGNTVHINANDVPGTPIDANTVDATLNWFGSAAGPAAGTVLGNVNVAPWLVATPDSGENDVVVGDDGSVLVMNPATGQFALTTPDGDTVTGTAIVTSTGKVKFVGVIDGVQVKIIGRMGGDISFATA